MTDQALVLITGANQGLGYYVAQSLASAGKYHVLIGSRSAHKGEEAVKSLLEDKSTPIDKSSVSAVQIDVSDDASIDAAVASVAQKYGKLDLLINNAGVSSAPGATTLREEYQALFNTNVAGLAIVTDKFEALLKASKYHDRRIVNVSSSVSRVSLAKKDHPYNAEHVPFPVYRATKAAVNMTTITQAARLRKDGITVLCVCPGYCSTNLNNYQGFKTPKDGAKAIVRAATTGTPEEMNATYVADEDMDDFGW